MRLTTRPNKGFINGRYYVELPKQDVEVINGIAHKIHTVIVHTFVLSDLDDADMCANELIYEWHRTEQGKWVMSHAVEPLIWHRHNDAFNFTIRYAITARLRGRDYTFWQLKWGNK